SANAISIFQGRSSRAPARDASKGTWTRSKAARGCATQLEHISPAGFLPWIERQKQSDEQQIHRDVYGDRFKANVTNNDSARQCQKQGEWKGKRKTHPAQMPQRITRRE